MTLYLMPMALDVDTSAAPSDAGRRHRSRRATDPGLEAACLPKAGHCWRDSSEKSPALAVTAARSSLAIRPKGRDHRQARKAALYARHGEPETARHLGRQHQMQCRQVGGRLPVHKIGGGFPVLPTTGPPTQAEDHRCRHFEPADPAPL